MSKLKEIIDNSETCNVIRRGIDAWEKTRKYNLDFKYVAQDQPLDATFATTLAIGSGIGFGAVTPLLYCLMNSSSLTEAGIYATGAVVCTGLGTKILAMAMDTAHIAERRIYTTFPVD